LNSNAAGKRDCIRSVVRGAGQIYLGGLKNPGPAPHFPLPGNFETVTAGPPVIWLSTFRWTPPSSCGPMLYWLSSQHWTRLPLARNFETDNGGATRALAVKTAMDPVAVFMRANQPSAVMSSMDQHKFISHLRS